MPLASPNWRPRWLDSQILRSLDWPASKLWRGCQPNSLVAAASPIQTFRGQGKQGGSTRRLNQPCGGDASTQLLHHPWTQHIPT